MLALNANTERRQRSMAVAFLQELPGTTQEQYDQVLKAFRGKTAEAGVASSRDCSYATAVLACPQHAQWAGVLPLFCKLKGLVCPHPSQALKFVPKSESPM